jgi:hypothetical protein
MRAIKSGLHREKEQKKYQFQQKNDDSDFLIDFKET